MNAAGLRITPISTLHEASRTAAGFKTTINAATEERLHVKSKDPGGETPTSSARLTSGMHHIHPPAMNSDIIFELQQQDNSVAQMTFSAVGTPQAANHMKSPMRTPV